MPRSTSFVYLVSCLLVPSAVVTALSGCAFEPDRAIAPTDDEVAVVGINGARLDGASRFWIPMNHEGEAVPLSSSRRAAFAILNGRSVPVSVNRVAVLPSDGYPEEFAVLAPTLAREQRVYIGDVAVPPGEQLDFDVRFAPIAVGPRRSTLYIDIIGEPPRWIALEGFGAPAEEAGEDPGPAAGAAPP